MDLFAQLTDEPEGLFLNSIIPAEKVHANIAKHLPKLRTTMASIGFKLSEKDDLAVKQIIEFMQQTVGAPCFPTDEALKASNLPGPRENYYCLKP